MRNLLVIAALAATSAAVFPAQAHAGYPFGHGYGLRSYSGYTGYTQDYVPYYAKHPPVYYSYPVARPYGYSPYAYPPTVLTPDPHRTGKATVLRNQYVPMAPAVDGETKEAARDTEVKARASDVIVNPFFHRDTTASRGDPVVQPVGD